MPACLVLLLSRESISVEHSRLHIYGSGEETGVGGELGWEVRAGQGQHSQHDTIIHSQLINTC